jgi:hypothetical protein
MTGATGPFHLVDNEASSMTAVQQLILDLAANGASATALKPAVFMVHPCLDNAQYLSALLGLQEEDRLVGQELDGEWHYQTRDNNSPDYQPLEYSAEFAEKIIAASCGEFTEIDIDAHLAQLLAMASKAANGHS